HSRGHPAAEDLSQGSGPQTHGAEGAIAGTSLDVAHRRFGSIECDEVPACIWPILERSFASFRFLCPWRLSPSGWSEPTKQEKKILCRDSHDHPGTRLYDQDYWMVVIARVDDWHVKQGVRDILDQMQFGESQAFSLSPRAGRSSSAQPFFFSKFL